MRTTNQFVARLAPCLVVIGGVLFAVGITVHNAPATVIALVSVVAAVFAWIEAS